MLTWHKGIHAGARSIGNRACVEISGEPGTGKRRLATARWTHDSEKADLLPHGWVENVVKGNPRLPEQGFAPKEVWRILFLEGRKTPIRVLADVLTFGVRCLDEDLVSGDGLVYPL